MLAFDMGSSKVNRMVPKAQQDGPRELRGCFVFYGVIALEERLQLVCSLGMAAGEAKEEYVYRISTAKEWEELQSSGSSFGGELDNTSGFIHLSNLNQVQSTLQNFFLNTKVDLYLLQIDVKKLGKGLVYEVVDGTNSFPHFYGPSRSFSSLPLDAVTKAEKLSLSGGEFSCSMLQ